MSEVKDWGARVAFFGLTRGYVMALEDVKEGRPASPPSLKSPEIKRVTDAAGNAPVTSFRSKPDSLRIFTHRDGDQDQMVLYVFSAEKTDGDSHLRYASLHMETDGEVTALVSDRRDRGQIEAWDATDNVLGALQRIVAFCARGAEDELRAAAAEVVEKSYRDPLVHGGAGGHVVDKQAFARLEAVITKLLAAPVPTEAVANV